MPPSEKQCGSCRQTRPLDEFYRNANGRNGRHSACKECMRGWERGKLAKYAARGEARIPAVKECGMCSQLLGAGRFSRSASTMDGLRTYCKHCDRVVRRADKYGLSRERVLEMLRQDRCEACGMHLPADNHKHIDHRHADGAVRGVLCSGCNTSLGQMGESEEALLGLVAYLRRTADVDYRLHSYVEQKARRQDSSPIEPFPPEGESTHV